MNHIRLKTVNSYMYEIYERISQNKPYDVNLKTYSDTQVKEVLKFFEEKEDFEKCQVISNFLNKRFNHIENYLK